MPVPSPRLKDLIEGTVDHHASQRWPALEEVTIRWSGSYGYLTGYLSEDDDDTIERCRIQYLGGPDEWAFAIWQASTDSYAESVLLDGRPAGHPNLALDTACTLYLADTSDHPVQPDKPLKDLRGAALVHPASPRQGKATPTLMTLTRPMGVGAAASGSTPSCSATSPNVLRNAALRAQQPLQLTRNGSRNRSMAAYSSWVCDSMPVLGRRSEHDAQDAMEARPPVDHRTHSPPLQPARRRSYSPTYMIHLGSRRPWWWNW